MGVAVQPMHSLSLPGMRDQNQLVDPVPKVFAACSDQARALLIETIRGNVMAWASWGRERNRQISQLRRME